MIDYSKRSTAASQRPSGDLGVVRVEISWDAPARGSVATWFRDVHSNLPSRATLYALAVPFDAGGRSLGLAWRDKPVNDVASLRHRVDIGQDDDSLVDVLVGGVHAGTESFVIDLREVDDAVDQMVFTVSAFRRYDLSRLGRIRYRLVEEDTEHELGSHHADGDGQEHNSRILGKLARGRSGWVLHPIGATSVGVTTGDFIAALRKHLR